MNRIFDWFDDVFFKWVFPVFFIILICVSILLCGYAIWWFVTTPSEEIKAVRLAEATPRLFAEVDDCKVYTWFADGHNHYFTRCLTKVTTESKYNEYCGKACSRKRTETIETIETERKK